MESIKGTRRCEGLMKIGYNVGRMISKELPDFIFRLAQDKIGVETNTYLLQEKRVLRYDSDVYYGLYQYYQDFSRSMDTKVIVDTSSTRIYLVNTQDFIGKPISDSRQNSYELALEGYTLLHHKKRHKYFQLTNSLCKVIGTPENNQFTYSGSCIDYWKSCYCDHVGIFKYEDKLDSYCSTVPQRRTKHGKHFDRQTNPRSAMKEKYM